MGKQIGIDLGTANTLIYQKGRGIVLRSPSVVAIDRLTGQLIAAGARAKQMLGKTPTNIIAYKPLKDGVIADIDVTTLMLNDFMRKCDLISTFNRPSILVCVPQGVTTVERRAVENAAYDAGARTVATMLEPMAAAIGVGMDVLAPEGNMIVDIGGGTTEIAVISLGGIVSNKSIKMAGDDLTNDIVEYMRRQHNIRVSERMAERIKINVGSALSILEDAPEDFEVCGPNQMTALPMKVPVSYQEIAHCLDKSISKIEAAVLSALEQTPPELYADIVKNGIYLAGGGALLRGIDKRLRDKMGIEFHVADDPLHAVARGTGIALKNIDKFNFLIR